VEPEIDFMQGYGLWKTGVRQLSVGASDRVSSIPNLFHPAPQDLKKVHWILVEYPASVESSCIANALQEKLPDILFDMAKDKSTVLIYKANCANIRSRLTLGILTPKTVLQAKMLKGQGRTAAKEAQMNIVRSYQSLPGEHITNMLLEKGDQMTEYNADALFDQVKGMTDEAFTKACLDARLNSKNERTKLETFLVDAIECRLKELRRIQGTNVTNVIYTNKVKGFVQSGSVFKDTWETLLVTVHDQSLLTPTMPRVGRSMNTVTLKRSLSTESSIRISPCSSSE
jgi:hypothetical protein